MTRPDAVERTTGIRRLVRAFGNSVDGLRAAFRQSAFRLELTVLVLFGPAGLWLGRTGSERALLTGSLGVILLVELLNSAIEAVVDRIGEEHHVLSGEAKDLGSAAVLVAVLLAVSTWLLVLGGRWTG